VLVGKPENSNEKDENDAKLNEVYSELQKMSENIDSHLENKL